MENQEHLKVYVCPFCEAQQYFNKINELNYHIHKEHLRQALNSISSKCLKTVSKAEKKWTII